MALLYLLSELCYCMFACMCVSVCMRACLCACMRLCVHVCICVSALVHACISCAQILYFSLQDPAGLLNSTKFNLFILFWLTY